MILERNLKTLVVDSLFEFKKSKIEYPINAKTFNVIIRFCPIYDNCYFILIGMFFIKRSCYIDINIKDDKNSVKSALLYLK